MIKNIEIFYKNNIVKNHRFVTIEREKFDKDFKIL